MLAEKNNQTVNIENELIHRLFVENYSSMCRTAYFALGDYGLAETAVQENFRDCSSFPGKAVIL